MLTKKTLPEKEENIIILQTAGKMVEVEMQNHIEEVKLTFSCNFNISIAGESIASTFSYLSYCNFVL